MTAAAITGLGLVSPYGHGTEVFWQKLLTGDPVTEPSPTSPATAGEPVARVPPAGETGATPRKQTWAREALAEALRAAGRAELPPTALLVIAGSTPCLPHPTSPHAASPLPDEVSGPDLRDYFGGARVYVTHACASAAFAMALAQQCVTGGTADIVAVVGASVLNPYDYSSMDVVRAVSPTGARPFDTTRDGITVGEGAGAVILEPAGGRRRGPLLAGASCRVGGGSASASDDETIAACMRDALAQGRERSRVHPGRLGYVHAHATGTPQGDAAELLALEGVARELGIHDLPSGSHKGAIGHLLHSSAFPGLVAAVNALRDGIAPPTAGLETPEPTERVHLLRRPHRIARDSTALVNGFGFGGSNASLLIAPS
ncbi:3-oxoacyl-ACP synthase [Sphaerisporangium album]|uniref:3-oxoacyl-ACP synthase n=1 Tax=Sphaerisporangium album TaxID=509200 RepID=A0A367FLA2_9ACTN|nr:beta-ketoacyl synthase N-terminal-like domain-containing protein [Sphaerisporangium album]RCG30669.1 3-oxoacyl-ACP synthase [Sphaerisporangium album]